MPKKSTVVILTRYIVSYAVVILVFVTWIVILYNTNYSTSRNVTDTYISASLDHGLRSLERIVIQLNGIQSYVSSDPNIIKLMNQKLPLHYSKHAEIIKFCNSFLALGTINHSVERLILVLPNGLIFSNEGLAHLSPNLFYGTFMSYSGLTESEWIEKLRTDFSFWESTVIAAKNVRQGEYLTYNCPASGKGLRLIALIARSELLNLFLAGEDQSRLRLQLFHGDKCLLDTTGSTAVASSETLISQRSEQLNLTVNVSVPPAFYAERIESLTGPLAASTGVVILFGIAMAIMFSLTNSKPIRNLASILNMRGEPVVYDPADSVQRLLSKMDAELRQSMEKTAEMQKSLSEIEFQLLLSMDTSGVPDNISLQLNDASIVLVLFKLVPAPGGGEPKRTVEDVIGQDYLLYSLDKNTRVLFYPWSEGGRNALDRLAVRVGEALAPLGVNWAASQPFSDIKQIKFAFLEAEFALSRGNASKYDVVHFSDIDVDIVNPLLSLSRYNALDVMLAGNKPEMIAPFFDQLRLDILSSSLTSKEIRQIAYRIRSVLFNHYEGQIDYARIFHVPHADCEPPAMESISEIEQICTIIAEQKLRAKSSHNEVLRSSVIALINQEFHNPNLSLSWLADELHTTPKYISNFIGEQLGKSYTDYVQQIRMEHAKHLLVTTDLTVNDVALNVGYMSSNAFYKSFRRFYNITPSELRKAARPKLP